MPKYWYSETVLQRKTEEVCLHTPMENLTYMSVTSVGQSIGQMPTLMLCWTMGSHIKAITESAVSCISLRIEERA